MEEIGCNVYPSDPRIGQRQKRGERGRGGREGWGRWKESVLVSKIVCLFGYCPVRLKLKEKEDEGRETHNRPWPCMAYASLPCLEGKKKHCQPIPSLRYLKNWRRRHSVVRIRSILGSYCSWRWDAWVVGSHILSSGVSTTAETI